jgi:hypothetical protein
MVEIEGRKTIQLSLSENREDNVDCYLLILDVMNTDSLNIIKETKYKGKKTIRILTKVDHDGSITSGLTGEGMDRAMSLIYKKLMDGKMIDVVWRVI